MACDACGKMTNDELLSMSDVMQRYLPFKYGKAKVCWGCNKKLNAELDKWRSIAWQKTALLLVDMMKHREAKDGK